MKRGLEILGFAQVRAGISDARFLFAGLQYLYNGPRKSRRDRPKELDGTVDIHNLPHPPLRVPDRVPLSGHETEHGPGALAVHGLRQTLFRLQRILIVLRCQRLGLIDSKFNELLSLKKVT